MSNSSVSRKQAADIARKHLESLSDKGEAMLQKQIASDPDNPEWSDNMFKKAKRGRPRLAEDEKSQPVTIKLDPAVIAFFKGDNPKGWQTRVNEALRKVAGL